MVVADASGCMKDAIVGRVKIEQRPLLLVEAEAEGSKVSLVLQNAETVRLVSEDGSAGLSSISGPGTGLWAGLPRAGVTSVSR